MAWFFLQKENEAGFNQIKKAIICPFTGKNKERYV